jgi:hypothetical protein
MKNRRPSEASLRNLRFGPGGMAAVESALANSGLGGGRDDIQAVLFEQI